MLKSRQHGVTTWAIIRGLDKALFTKNCACGIVAHTQHDASKFFRDKLLFAYDRLPAWLRAEISVVRRDMNGSLELSNGSRIDVSVSHRGGTLQFLHISEYGPLCAMFPQRAQEVKTGALNTVTKDCIVTIESTSYGGFGDFYEKCKRAMAMEAEVKAGTATLSAMDYKLHFFPWWRDDSNRLDPTGVVITKEDIKYFEGVEAEIARKLDPEQRAWYVKKRAEQDEAMLREHPSTPEEAFKAAVEGAYYTRQMQDARGEGRIGRVPHTLGTPVNTFWDLGFNDAASIWFHQQVSLENRFIRSFEKGGEHIPYFAKYLQEMRTEHGYVYGTHYLPHDAESSTIASRDVLTLFKEAMPGEKFEVVERIPNIWTGIQQTRQVFPSCYFDAVNCADGLKALGAYRKHWDARHSIFTSDPEHDEYSNYADAFRQFAQGYQPAQKLVKPPAWQEKIKQLKQSNRRRSAMAS